MSKSTSPMAFSFGAPEAVLDTTLTSYLGVFLNPHGDYYAPPVSLTGLAKLLRANAHHGTIPYFKRNMLRKFYVPSPVLSATDLENAGFDYLVFGMCYFQKIFNRLGQIVRLQHIPALNMRRMKAPDQFCLLQPNQVDPLAFRPGEIIQLKEYDVNQQIYGVPQYLGGLQSVLLNESATLFRRKYYNNGAHMGFIFYTADAQLDPEDEQSLKEQIRASKGVGNFRSLYINIPGGKPDSVKIIPVGDIATKDEFERVKNLSRNDVLSMWRIQPALAGIMPENTGGFGDIEKISRVYYENEVVPMQHVFLKLNEDLSNPKQIRFLNPLQGMGN
ncbi:phage portal protein [Hahella sp. HN01]|uniref:phage portal protein n=1 Tax=Hahella sp. HN01 TaxID=2847262 RepID=UPI001C1F0972|nr:phage portal protein [Hahella sp. HN01]MBU6951009.1 phage portal protein [Hahella sp. HN01]